MPDTPVENAQFMIPMLICRDSAAEIDFCRTAFGAVELSRRAAPDGYVLHATLAIGKALVMVHGVVESLPSQPPQPDGSSAVVVYAYIQEIVDEVVARAVAAGARVLIAVSDLPWGDRMARIIDPAGHVWNVANRPAEISPKDANVD